MTPVEACEIARKVDIFGDGLLRCCLDVDDFYGFFFVPSDGSVPYTSGAITCVDKKTRRTFCINVFDDEYYDRINAATRITEIEDAA